MPVDREAREGEEEPVRVVVDQALLLHRRVGEDLPPLDRGALRGPAGGEEDGVGRPEAAPAVDHVLDAGVVRLDLAGGPPALVGGVDDAGLELGGEVDRPRRGEPGGADHEADGAQDLRAHRTGDLVEPQRPRAGVPPLEQVELLDPGGAEAVGRGGNLGGPVRAAGERRRGERPSVENGLVEHVDLGLVELVVGDVEHVDLDHHPLLVEAHGRVVGPDRAGGPGARGVGDQVGVDGRDQGGGAPRGVLVQRHAQEDTRGGRPLHRRPDPPPQPPRRIRVVEDPRIEDRGGGDAAPERAERQGAQGARRSGPGPAPGC